ncbi:hypothetical protein K466DRAFT_218897 [Polyporus arcularius HHB13444]|uniref:Uncharacterized protein n=1 Tax=Polyporus arcularius HHB13444 TaxID=1314778 RepID=A0A5C3P7T8_9APHY|nr:hypothetical protein K466DRAFT_218897 [Polyporus arcularius HHB13444]
MAACHMTSTRRPRELHAEDYLLRPAPADDLFGILIKETTEYTSPDQSATVNIWTPRPASLSRVLMAHGPGHRICVQQACCCIHGRSRASNRSVLRFKLQSALPSSGPPPPPPASPVPGPYCAAGVGRSTSTALSLWKHDVGLSRVRHAVVPAPPAAIDTRSKTKPMC